MSATELEATAAAARLDRDLLADTRQRVLAVEAAILKYNERLAENDRKLDALARHIDPLGSGSGADRGVCPVPRSEYPHA